MSANTYFFLIFIKMSNNSSTKYYQNNKERPQKLVKNIKVYLKKKKEKK